MEPNNTNLRALWRRSRLGLCLLGYSAVVALALSPWAFRGVARAYPLVWYGVLLMALLLPGLVVYLWGKRRLAEDMRDASDWVRRPKQTQLPQQATRLMPLLQEVAALKQALLRQQRIQETNSAAHAIVNLDNGQVVFANRAAIEVFAKGRASLIGEHYSKYFNDWELLGAYRDEFQRHGQVRHVRVQIGDAISGQRYWYSVDIHRTTLHQLPCVSATLYRIPEQQVTDDLPTTQEGAPPHAGAISERELRLRVRRALYSAHARKATHTFCHFEFQVLGGEGIAATALYEQFKHRFLAVFQGELRARDSVTLRSDCVVICLLEHCDLDEAQGVINHVREAIEQEEFEIHGQVRHVGVRVGAVVINRACRSVDNVLEVAADDCAHAPAIKHEPSEERFDYLYSLNRYTELEWVARIQKALEQDHWQVYLQPLEVNQKKNKPQPLKALEVVLRLKDVDGELLMPKTFMPVAERFKLATKVDTWLIKAVARRIERHRERFAEYQFCAVPVSIQSLMDERFIHLIETTLDESVRRRVCIEVPEAKMVANILSLEKNLQTLKALGCQIAFSEFGASLTSFRYIKSLPVDVVKIDNHFIKGAEQDSVDFSLVQSINHVCQALGCYTVADMVENRAARDLVEDLGVDYLQGYSVAAPVAVDYALEREAPAAVGNKQAS